MATATSTILTMEMAAEEGVKRLLRAMLENGTVAGVIALKRTSPRSGGDESNADTHTYKYTYTLATDKNELERSSPLAPVMPRNLGKIVSHLTHLGEFPSLVAVVVRPCELCAFVEMLKRNQAMKENILVISTTCSGVVPTKEAFEDDGSIFERYWDAVEKAEEAPDIRPTCGGCVAFTPPPIAEMTVLLIGEEPRSRCRILLTSERAKELVGQCGIEDETEIEIVDSERTVTAPLPEETMDAVMTARRKTQRALSDNMPFDGGLASLVDIFGRCIGCHACGDACPICYCQLCRFEREGAKQETPLWERELARRGGLRVPSNTIYYHIGRMTHMAISCVACGSCTDVCPVDIPVAQLFKSVGEATQGMFDYVPGDDEGEDIPIRTFAYDELHAVEE